MSYAFDVLCMAVALLAAIAAALLLHRARDGQMLAGASASDIQPVPTRGIWLHGDE